MAGDWRRVLRVSDHPDSPITGSPDLAALCAALPPPYSSQGIPVWLAFVPSTTPDLLRPRREMVLPAVGFLFNQGHQCESLVFPPLRPSRPLR
jgi:hypothetical protein